MKKLYYLKSCGTCLRIIKELGGLEGFVFQNIKEQNIDAAELDALARKVGSYEQLFSKRAMKYKSLGLAQKQLSEKDYRKYILEEYTFLKRPVIVSGDQVFVGNAPSTVAAAREALL